MALKNVIKSDGEIESFSEQKLMRSLRRAGIEKNLAEEVADEVQGVGTTVESHKLHDEVYKKLVKKNKRSHAGRYNLKRALTQLGPSGYPFEQFVARLLAAKGYKVTTNKIVRGHCVSHEIDVLAEKDNRHFIFECKFHNRQGFKSDVQTALYMKARADDIKKRWDEKEGKKKKHLHRAWIITNTQFTSEAIKYGNCGGNIGLISWRAPRGHSLAELIEETGLHPITAVTSLSKKQKEYIVSHGLVLCSEAHKKQDVLVRAGVRGGRLKRVLREAADICERS